MVISDYLQAKQTKVLSAEALADIAERQSAERVELRARLAALDFVSAPYAEHARADSDKFIQMRRRLINVVVEHKYRWPTAHFYVHGGREWFHSRVWLRMAKMEYAGGKPYPGWQWWVDIDLFTTNEKLNRIWKCFGPEDEQDSRNVIIAKFQTHLAATSKILEDSGYIIVPDDFEL